MMQKGIRQGNSRARECPQGWNELPGGLRAGGAQLSPEHGKLKSCAGCPSWVVMVTVSLGQSHSGDGSAGRDSTAVVWSEVREVAALEPNAVEGYPHHALYPLPVSTAHALDLRMVSLRSPDGSKLALSRGSRAATGLCLSRTPEKGPPLTLPCV